MDLADFHAMERLFDAAGFGLNASDVDTCPADFAPEDAGTKRTIINISAVGKNKGWLASVDIDDVLMMLAVDMGADMTIVNKSKVLSFSSFEFHTSMPLDIMYGVTDPELPCTTVYVECLRANLAYMHEEARVHLGPKLKAQKKYFVARLKHRKFEVGGWNLTESKWTMSGKDPMLY
jgi:hypothetical protein